MTQRVLTAFALAPFGRLGGGRKAASACVLLVVMMWLIGCTPADAGKNLAVVQPDWDTFNREVLQSPQPVVIEFGKDPCPPCTVQKAELDLLADEFNGRISFRQMTLLKGEFIALCPQIREQYRIMWVPTTLLFVNGQERRRWEHPHKAAEIREELVRVLAESAVPAPPGPK